MRISADLRLIFYALRLAPISHTRACSYAFLSNFNKLGTRQTNTHTHTRLALAWLDLGFVLICGILTPVVVDCSSIVIAVFPFVSLAITVSAATSSSNA